MLQRYYQKRIPEELHSKINLFLQGEIQSQHYENQARHNLGLSSEVKGHQQKTIRLATHDRGHS